MTKPAVVVEHVGKKFARSLKRSMTYGLMDIGRAALVPHRFRSEGFEARLRDAGPGVEPAAPRPLPPLRPTEFWALRDVSFTVQPGECYGLIGANGAGKSTLFSIISGIYAPTLGRVEINGSLQALIALGAGFHPTLSGRENIYINAAILGMKARAIDALIEEIIDFSEIGEFIEMPVKRYSSGMLVRLGFAVAVHMKPDVLLIDEVLSVGDMAFRNKSFAKMMSLINSGISLLFVSHWVQAVEMVCPKAIWIDGGRVRLEGSSEDVITAYTSEVDENLGKRIEFDDQEAQALFPIRVTRVEVLDDQGQPLPEPGWKQPVTIRLHYQCTQPVAQPYFQVRLRRPGWQEKDISLFCMHDDRVHWNFEPGTGHIDCRIAEPRFGPGCYEIRCGIMRSPTILTGQGAYQELFTAGTLEVRATREEIGRPGTLHAFLRSHPPVLLDHEWRRP